MSSLIAKPRSRWVSMTAFTTPWRSTMTRASHRGMVRTPGTAGTRDGLVSHTSHQGPRLGVELDGVDPHSEPPARGGGRRGPADGHGKGDRTAPEGLDGCQVPRRDPCGPRARAPAGRRSGRSGGPVAGQKAQRAAPEAARRPVRGAWRLLRDGDDPRDTGLRPVDRSRPFCTNGPRPHTPYLDRESARLAIGRLTKRHPR